MVKQSIIYQQFTARANLFFNNKNVTTLTHRTCFFGSSGLVFKFYCQNSIINYKCLLSFCIELKISYILKHELINCKQAPVSDSDRFW